MTDQELGEAIINQARHVANLTAAYETAKAARREFDRAVSDAAEQRFDACNKLNDLIDQAGAYGLKATP
jgi:hypothetical protein